jgi:hypothetical protein
MSANLRLGREIMRENMTRAARLNYMRNHPVEWAPGERERLIEEAIAQGKVTKYEPIKAEFHGGKWIGHAASVITGSHTAHYRRLME